MINTTVDEMIRRGNLYRYYRFTDPFSVRNLANGIIYLSPPNMYSDPFDCCIPLDLTRVTRENIYDNAKELASEVVKNRGGGIPEYLTELQELCNAVPDNLEEWRHQCEGRLIQIRENLGVACFSHACNHPLMWTHYADGHRGFMVEYNVEALIRSAMARNMAIDSVEYQAEIDPIVVTPDSTWGLDQVRRKLASFEYEREVRVFGDQVSNRLLQLEEGTVVSVTTGLNIDKDGDTDDFATLVENLPAGAQMYTNQRSTHCVGLVRSLATGIDR